MPALTSDAVAAADGVSMACSGYTAGGPSTSTETLDPDDLPPPRVHDRPQVKSIICRAGVARALDEV